MAWIICPNEICGERFALSDDTEAFARAHEGLRLVCPFGHAIWPFPTPSEAVKPPEAEKPKNTRKRVLPVTEAEQAALDEPEEPTHVQTPEEVAAEAREAAELVGLQGPQLEINKVRSHVIKAMADAGRVNAEDKSPQQGATAAESPAEPDTAASPASDVGTETEAGSEAITADTGPEESDDDADAEGLGGLSEAQDALDAEEVDNDSLPPELQALITATETVDSWQDFKLAMGAFQKSELWPTLSPDQQNHVRASAWDTLVDRSVDWTPDPAHDVSAFRIYIESEGNPDQIKATFALLKADVVYQGKSDNMKEQVEAAASARLADLER